MLMGLFSMLCVPLWIFGKRLRIATSDRVRQWNDQQQQS
jgi:hypothetical protein